MTIHAFGDFELDTSLYQLRRSGEIVEIGPRVFDLLTYLIAHRDRLVTKHELIREVWGATAMSGSSVPTCIAAVRKALGDDPANPEFVETHRGRGYRFVAAVTEILDEPATVSRPVETGRTATAHDASRPIFVGRDRELTLLYAAFERALAATPQLVLIAGDAGIGKTRTIEELAVSVRDDGAIVLLGRCIEGGGAPAFWPWIQIVRTYAESSDLSGIPMALGPLAPSLLQMSPDLAEQMPDVPRPADDDSEQARFRLFDAVTMLLTKAASERPLVLLLDDLHRADVASLLLLQFAIRELRDAPVLVVGTYRETELHSDSARATILSDLTREEPTRNIQLHGLSKEGVARFIAESSPSGTAGSSLASALHDQTAGNPFFLTQIIHLLAAEGRLDDDDEEREWKFELPGGIREAISRQLDGLPRETVTTLSIAAVAGREFSLGVIAAAADRNPTEALRNLEPAIEARLLAPVPGHIGRYRFAHMLLRDCIYDELPTVDRAQRHLEIADALEALHATNLDPHASELAYHFYEALPNANRDKIIDYSIRAAKWATARLAYEDAPTHYRRAIRVLDENPPPDPLARGKMLLTLGEAEIRASERDHARTTLIEAAAAARTVANAELLALSALGLAPGFFAIEVGIFDPILVALLEEALDALPSGDNPLRAQVLARLSTALVWSDSDSRQDFLSQKAHQMALRIDDPLSIAKSLSARHESLWGTHDFELRSATIQEIAKIASRVNDQETHLMHHLLKITVHLESGDVVAADQEIQNYGAIADQTRQPRFLWYIPLLAGMRALMIGKFSEAESLAHRFRLIGEHAQDSNALQSFGTHIAILRWEQSRSDEILPSVEEFISRYPGVAAWRCVRMFLNQDLGNIDASRAEFESLSRDDFRSIANNTNRLVSLCLLAEVCADLKDQETASTLYERLLPEKNLNAIIGFSTGFFGSVEERLGLLAASIQDFARAHQHFHAAILSHRRIRAAPWVARVEYYLATLLIEQEDASDPERAWSLLESSERSARRMKMMNLLSKIELIKGKIGGR